MDQKTAKIVNSFAKIAKEEYPDCQVYLFGSRAKGTARKDSDYDFILVSKEFKKQNFLDRYAKAYFLKRNIPAAMDILCYTPEEFNKKKKEIGIVQEAVKEGIII
ncbi:MAG: nucleotidyltransferase domain-containing protein [Nanoarchaeota archaeon]